MPKFWLLNTNIHGLEAHDATQARAINGDNGIVVFDISAWRLGSTCLSIMPLHRRESYRRRGNHGFQIC